MKQSSTGKHLCSRCQNLATYRLPGLDRKTGELFYAYQCELHALKESEPMFDEAAITATIGDLEMDTMLQEMDYIDAREAAKDAREATEIDAIELARKEVNAIETKLVHLVQSQQIHRADFVEMCLCLDVVKRSFNSIEAGVCPQCGSIPAHGLLEVAGERFCATDCPGQDSKKYCDHRCVGAIVRNPLGHILLFQRGTYPFSIAGPAGHLDGDEANFAVGKEVQEEVGLLVASAKLVTQFWHPSRCRRRYAGTHGHHWSFFEVVAAGDLQASERETRPDSLHWYSPDEICKLMRQTECWLAGESPVEHLDIPWYELFCKLDEM